MKTKREAMALFIGLKKLANLKGVKFAYFVTKNMAALLPEMKALEEVSAPSEEYQEFDKKRVELIKKFAKKNDKGGFNIVDGNYELEDEKGMEEAFEVLKAENKEVWDARKEQEKEYTALLETPSEAVLHKINLDEIPADISVAQMLSITDLVDESIKSPFVPKQ